MHGGNIRCLEAELLSEKEIEHKPYGAGTFVALLHCVSRAYSGSKNRSFV